MPSHKSQSLLSEEGETRDLDLLDDEGLIPEQPTFTGLFPHGLFKLLLFKVKNSARLGAPSAPPETESTPASSDPLFSEPTADTEFSSSPGLFISVGK